VIEVNGGNIEAAVPVTLPEQEHSDTNEGTGNGIVTQDQSPAAQQDPISRHMEAIGKAESWKANEPEHYAGMFGPYPEELE
jgi:hypothetical protein